MKTASDLYDVNDLFLSEIFLVYSPVNTNHTQAYSLCLNMSSVLFISAPRRFVDSSSFDCSCSLPYSLGKQIVSASI